MRGPDLILGIKQSPNTARSKPEKKKRISKSTVAGKAAAFQKVDLGSNPGTLSPPGVIPEYSTQPGRSSEHCWVWPWHKKVKNTLIFDANWILLNFTMNAVAYHFPVCNNLSPASEYRTSFERHAMGTDKREKLVINWYVGEGE